MEHPPFYGTRLYKHICGTYYTLHMIQLASAFLRQLHIHRQYFYLFLNSSSSPQKKIILKLVVLTAVDVLK